MPYDLLDYRSGSTHLEVVLEEFEIPFSLRKAQRMALEHPEAGMVLMLAMLLRFHEVPNRGYLHKRMIWDLRQDCLDAALDRLNLDVVEKDYQNPNASIMLCDWTHKMLEETMVINPKLVLKMRE